MRTSCLRVSFILVVLLFVTNTHAACTGLGCSCSVATTAVSFGTYTASNATALISSNGLVSVTCSVLVLGLNVSYTIAFSSGSSGNFTNRTMTRSSNNLRYNLYTTAALSTIWGDGTGGTGTVSDSYFLNLLSQTRNYTVYGSIPISQYAVAGDYSDTIIVTVTY